MLASPSASCFASFSAYSFWYIKSSDASFRACSSRISSVSALLCFSFSVSIATDVFFSASSIIFLRYCAARRFRSATSSSFLTKICACSRDVLSAICARRSSLSFSVAMVRFSTFASSSRFQTSNRRSSSILYAFFSANSTSFLSSLALVCSASASAIARWSTRFLTSASAAMRSPSRDRHLLISAHSSFTPFGSNRRPFVVGGFLVRFRF
mmetsp:Transcript_5538/g.20950  ORF Transcript_5538/g.20950 Transcript_5538/m.20950 type:complete len:211 (+) Transcript_5538:592-1224(+)